MMFDTEMWKYVIVLGMGLLIAILYLWNTMELRANRRAQDSNTEAVRLWMLAFDAVRKQNTVYPVKDVPDHPNDMLK